MSPPPPERRRPGPAYHRRSAGAELQARSPSCFSMLALAGAETESVQEDSAASVGARSG